MAVYSAGMSLAPIACPCLLAGTAANKGLSILAGGSLSLELSLLPGRLFCRCLLRSKVIQMSQIEVDQERGKGETTFSTTFSSHIVVMLVTSLLVILMHKILQVLTRSYLSRKILFRSYKTGRILQNTVHDFARILSNFRKTHFIIVQNLIHNIARFCPRSWKILLILQDTIPFAI